MIPALCLALLAQDPDLAAVRQSQQARVATIERCAPAVCSVMDMSAPGGGSGVVIDARGFVLTNYHVVGQPDTAKQDAKPMLPEPPAVLPEPPAPPTEVLAAWEAAHPGATEDARAAFVSEWQAEWRAEHLPQGKHHWRNKKVGLPDGELYEAVVLGIDPGSDLAMLRLLPKREGQRWPCCELGDSDALLVGETVFAMGNPFLLATDFTPTVTFGIVSGTHRYQEGQGRMLVYPDCIQVDAPVNPGNSGGPLFNEQGQVVGINGRISIGDRGRVNVGVGFAIASNQIANFLGDLLAGRHAEHGTLDMSAWFMAAPREATQRRGVFVQQIFKDSVAATAGLKLGDEVTAFDGERVRSANQLATMVGVLPAGAWVTLGFRPAVGDSGYGDERTEALRLAAMDTGSSADTRADTQRLASRTDRRLATQALLERLPRQGKASPIALTFTAPDGTVHRCRRDGERLRLDLGDTVLVRTGPGAGFAVQAGATSDLTPEQAARLEREFLGNPLLRTQHECAAMLETGLLVGGSHVLGAPAFRFALPGEGEIEVLLYRDGGAAGYALRDPLRKRKVEVHVRGDHVRVVVDGQIEAGWRIEGPTAGPLDDALFRRPQ